jgi:hypothetical protein
MIGGGPTAESSQLSIEQNMVFFRRALLDLGRSDITPHVLFASGGDLLPDVCQRSLDRLPPANRLLAKILGHAGAIELEYRTHDIGAVDGSARREQIVQALAAKEKELRAGDRLVIYVSGHGGKGDPTSNGHLHTWDHGEISVKDFAELLDRFDPEVEVLLVMVQCYSGAFANILFEGGDPDRPLAKHKRAGFFATVDSRPAAGCTADTKVSDYQEYSTSFLSALCGKDRAGQSVAVADLDADGVISLAEAHAHALETLPTIDLCYRTSDRYLQSQARLDDSDPSLMAETATLADLLSAADPLRAHSLRLLVEELGLPKEGTMREAARLSKEISAQRRRSRGSRQKTEDEADKQARQIEDTLLTVWPFLESGWHPQTHALLAHHPEQVIEAIEEHHAYAAWKKASEKSDEMAREDLVKERQWAKYQRVLLLAKSIARAENLKREGSVEQRERYEKLLLLENSHLKRREAGNP